MFRWIIFFLWFPLYSIFLNVFSRCCYQFPWFKKKYQWLLRRWANCILWAAKIKIQISKEDKDKLDSYTSRIIIANHKSHLDSIIIWSIMPEKVFLCFAAKKELFSLPIYGKILEHNESVIIDRKNPKHAFKELKRFFTSPNSKSLTIYAEGTRNRSKNHLLPFKNGPFIVAHLCKLPILPILIQGTEKTMPAGKIWPKPAAVKVKVLPLISSKELNENGPSKIKEKIWTQMNEYLTRQNFW